MIIDGADKVESLLITDAMSSNVLSFLKESTRLLKLHIDGTDFYANCKRMKKVLKGRELLIQILETRKKYFKIPTWWRVKKFQMIHTPWRFRE